MRNALIKTETCLFKGLVLFSRIVGTEVTFKIGVNWCGKNAKKGRKKHKCIYITTHTHKRIGLGATNVSGNLNMTFKTLCLSKVQIVRLNKSTSMSLKKIRYPRTLKILATLGTLSGNKNEDVPFLVNKLDLTFDLKDVREVTDGLTSGNTFHVFVASQAKL